MASIDYKNIAKSKYIESVILFLEENLPDFPNEVLIKTTHAEPFMNKSLERFLENKARYGEEEYPFSFDGEPIHESEPRKRVDIGVYISVKGFFENLPFFTIEAKRLPTPRATEEERKEYVTGVKGGIARFKKNEHGVNLPINAMIGYIEKEEFVDWQKQINNWILSLNGTIETNKDSNKDITWDSTEILEFIYQKEIAKLQSTHPRVNSTAQNFVTLIHFWVKIKS
jgi:hypothetical protein